MEGATLFKFKDAVIRLGTAVGAAAPPVGHREL